MGRGSGERRMDLAAPCNTSYVACKFEAPPYTHVIGPSWKMLNQPPVSALTLAMTKNY